MPVYDAFISYSHAKDKPIAAALQSVIQKLGKPWYRRRGLRVFRDDTSLSATPQLWPSIEQALAQSRYLLLLSSPESAASPWVGKEVEYWLANKSIDTLLIGVTDGTLDWDGKKGDFRWKPTPPLPAVLKGRFPAEPKWVDLTAYREGANPRDHSFLDLGADFAAAIHGMPKEDLLSQEVRQQTARSVAGGVGRRSAAAAGGRRGHRRHHRQIRGGARRAQFRRRQEHGGRLIFNIAARLAQRGRHQGREPRQDPRPGAQDGGAADRKRSRQSGAVAQQGGDARRVRQDLSCGGEPRCRARRTPRRATRS